jgi:hypothetical protein
MRLAQQRGLYVGPVVGDAVFFRTAQDAATPGSGRSLFHTSAPTASVRAPCSTLQPGQPLSARRRGREASGPMPANELTALNLSSASWLVGVATTLCARRCSSHLSSGCHHSGHCRGSTRERAGEVIVSGSGLGGSRSSSMGEGVGALPGVCGSGADAGGGEASKDDLSMGGCDGEHDEVRLECRQ